MTLKVLDVTLRDGGYRNGFSFSREYAREHLRRMTNAGIEWIEIGYRNGSFKAIPNIGTTGLSPDSYLQAMRAETADRRLCVMFHPKNITLADLDRMRELGVDMVRACWDGERADLSAQFAQHAKALGFTVCVNLTRISSQPPKRLLGAAERARESGADVVYLADSNGSLTPERVESLVRVVREVVQCDVGFHAHDNLGLAMTNSIAAVTGGATFIDSSLRGMGKGAGNLKLELWLGFLRRVLGIERYDYRPVLDQVHVLESADAEARPIQPLVDLVMGLFDLTVEDKDRIQANARNISQVFENASV